MDTKLRFASTVKHVILKRCIDVLLWDSSSKPKYAIIIYIIFFIMTVEDLKNLINSVTYLNADEKKKWVHRLPDLSIPNLKLLARVFLLAEKKKAKLRKDHDLVLGTFMDFLKELNNYAKNKAKKTVLKQLEIESNDKEKQILNQLTDDMQKL